VRYPDYFNKKFHWKTALLLPLAGLVWLLSEIRRYLYKLKLLQSTQFNVPVIVVGNILVGGAGKTPLVIYLAEYFKSKGLKVGVVSRGYGANTSLFPYSVLISSKADVVGDEPLMLARRTGCPVVIDPDRVSAVRYLLAEFNCDLVIADDGMQHFKLARDIDILVEDGQRKLGNGFLLPAGPLRESMRHARHAHLRISNCKVATGNYYEISSLVLTGIGSDVKKDSLSDFRSQPVHAVAGIAYPERFFDLLESHELVIHKHTFADHHHYQQHELEFKDDFAVIMTEKDAVKCYHFGLDNTWFVQINIKPNDDFIVKLDQLVEVAFEKYSKVEQSKHKKK